MPDFDCETLSPHRVLSCDLSSSALRLHCCYNNKPSAPRIRRQRQKQASKENPYLRVVYGDREEPIAMQTSVVTFRPPNDESGVTVDLIGAVHVADKGYFRSTQSAIPTVRRTAV